jgi:hypothetical protein
MRAFRNEFRSLREPWAPTRRTRQGQTALALWHREPMLEAELKINRMTI